MSWYCSSYPLWSAILSILRLYFLCYPIIHQTKTIEKVPPEKKNYSLMLAVHCIVKSVYIRSMYSILAYTNTTSIMTALRIFSALKKPWKDIFNIEKSRILEKRPNFAGVHTWNFLCDKMRSAVYRWFYIKTHHHKHHQYNDCVSMAAAIKEVIIPSQRKLSNFSHGFQEAGHTVK